MRQRHSIQRPLFAHLPTQEVAAADGLGDHALAPGPVPVHVYVIEPCVFRPPPMEKPDAQVVVICWLVVPDSVPPVLTPDGKMKVVQVAAASQRTNKQTKNKKHHTVNGRKE